MKELIETIVKPLVDFPDDVHVDVHEEDTRITYQLSVHKSDMGKVIGKAGARSQSDTNCRIRCSKHVTEKKDIFGN